MNVRAEKTDEKKGVICLVSMFPSWFMVLKLAWKVNLLQFNADLSNKFKSVKAVYIYASERSRYALSENDFVHYAMTYCFGDIEGLMSTNFVKLLMSQHIFWYLNCQYFMNGGSDPYKPYHFLKECNENFQMHIYKLF